MELANDPKAYRGLAQGLPDTPTLPVFAALYHLSPCPYLRLSLARRLRPQS